MNQNSKIGVNQLLERIDERFNYIAEIHVSHIPEASDPSMLIFTIHAGGADAIEQNLDITPAEVVTIDVAESGSFQFPFEVIATCDGAGHLQGAHGTTVYMDEDTLGARPRTVDTGLTILQQKLTGVCPSCDGEIETLRQHYRDNTTCIKDQFGSE